VNKTIKLSSPATREFWEVSILFEDEHLLAVDKPSRLLTSPDRYDPLRPNLMKLLHHDIERGAAWVRERQLTYLANAHRLDFETSGVILLAKNKPALVAVANQFGAEKPFKRYTALVQGAPPQPQFTVNVAIAPHPVQTGLMRADSRFGKRSLTQFEALEYFRGCTLLKCLPQTGRTHQIRVHLRHVKLPIVGDELYGGRPLLLSSMKSVYRLKPGQVERPLMSRVALHAEELVVKHPVTGTDVVITAPWPRDLSVALKYLRRYAAVSPGGQKLNEPMPDDKGEDQQDHA
jgi:RluA family pseudouridine synthase